MSTSSSPAVNTAITMIADSGEPPFAVQGGVGSALIENAQYVVTVSTGLFVQAATGATREELLEAASYALQNIR